MELKEVKSNLNKIVRYRNNMSGLDCDYRLTACILRKDKNGHCFYQVELQDLKSNCILYGSLENVEVKI